MAQSEAGKSTDEESLKKIYDDGMKLFDIIENGKEATNSEPVQGPAPSAALPTAQPLGNLGPLVFTKSEAEVTDRVKYAYHLETMEIVKKLLETCKTMQECKQMRKILLDMVDEMSIRSAISKFEKATNLVSLSGMFSKNESLEELPTETLQYLLLPALLGTLSLKLVGRARTDVIQVAEIYFKDFLQRCKDYGIPGAVVPQPSPDGQTRVQRTQSEQAKIASMVLSREAKIKRFKEAKELQEKLSSLSKAMSSTADDETKREYFLTLLQTYINQALDELTSIEQERPILEYMASHAADPKPKQRERPSPLKPIIITRDAVQKAVYGAGYPSIPAMTVEEFYEQRVKEGLFPDACSNIPHTTIQTTEAEKDEVEEVRKDLLEEEDDEEERARQRNMDEYKDDHRRGWGNRYNRS